MSEIIVQCKFNSGSGDYILPHIFTIYDPAPGIKNVIIEGNRSSGSIVIPGNKQSQEITVKGRLIADGYKDLTDLINEMRSKVTTDEATLTLSHDSIPDWEYTVRRLEKIEFSESERTDEQEYQITFLVLSDL